MIDIWISKKSIIHLINPFASPPNFKALCGFNIGSAANISTANKNVVFDLNICKKCSNSHSLPMIKEKTKKSYIIRGVEIREGDKLISIREFSSSYGARNKRIEVQLIKGVTLRLINLPIEIDHKIKSNLLKAVLVIKTLNSVQNIIYHVTFGMFAKKKYKFKIKCH